MLREQESNLRQLAYETIRETIIHPAVWGVITPPKTEHENKLQFKGIKNVAI